MSQRGSLNPQYFPEVNGKRGAVQFKSTIPIYGLGIRFNGTAFTSMGAIVARTLPKFF
jgi:hypothetical protein